MPEQKHIIKGIIFRLVKKHIAGYTTESALGAIRRINGEKLHTTVTLLNDHTVQAAKARYNTNAYVQLMKQISRLNLNSDVSLRLTQIGYSIDHETMGKNLQQIVETANENKLRVWIEDEVAVGASELMPLYRDIRDNSDYLGVEMNPGQEANNSAFELIEPKDMVKLRCHKHCIDGNIAKKERTNTLKQYCDYINRLTRMKANVTVLDQNAHMINKLVASNKGYKQQVTFEAPMGYGSEKLKKLAEKRYNVSVYVPYGKDWVPYMINRLTEGRIRNIAIALLNGKDSGYAHGGY